MGMCWFAGTFDPGHLFEGIINGHMLPEAPTRIFVTGEGGDFLLNAPTVLALQCQIVLPRD